MVPSSSFLNCTVLSWEYCPVTVIYLVECTERCCISSLIWLCVSRAFSFTHWSSSIYFSRLAPVEMYPLFMNLELWSHRMKYQPLGLISVAQHNAAPVYRQFWPMQLHFPIFTSSTTDYSYANFLKGHPYSGFYIFTKIGLSTSFSSNQIDLPGS